MDVYDSHTDNPLVQENRFRGMPVNDCAPPDFAACKDHLPQPVWENHPTVVDCYWKAWELAFGNLRVPQAGSGFVAPFIDTAFNGCLFLWDSAFALMFGRYGCRAFNFQQTLDNFYATQHRDGYFCRQIDQASGLEVFERFDPSSTGPNVLPWCEWEYFVNTGDHERLQAVFPVLLAYSQWFSKNRTWPDGSYWSSGYGCGMDDQPRLPPGCHVSYEHGHMSWVDTTCQQVLANRVLIDMGKTLGRETCVEGLVLENRHLEAFLNQNMWNQDEQFYVDRFRDGTLSSVKSVGSFWALLADVVPAERMDALIAHLADKDEFARPHCVPSLSADHPQYDPEHCCWRGAVWAPTTYMVLRGLTQAGCDDLAHEIGLNHLQNVVSAFVKQGTLYESYSPEQAKGMGNADFVGWTGVPPIAVLFEYAFGLRPDVANQRLLWDLRLLDGHGVRQYPFGAGGMIDLYCAERTSRSEAPAIRVSADVDLKLAVRWHGGQQTLTLSAGEVYEGEMGSEPVWSTV